MEEAKTNGEIGNLSVKLQGVLTTVMINTGANISLIEKTIEQDTGCLLYTSRCV